MVKGAKNSSCKNVSMKGTRNGGVKKILREGTRKSARQNESRFSKTITSALHNALNNALTSKRSSPHTSNNNMYSNEESKERSRCRRATYRAERNAEKLDALTAAFGQAFALSKPRPLQSKPKSRKGKAPARRKVAKSKKSTEPPSLEKYLNLHGKFMKQRKEGKMNNEFKPRQRPYLENSYQKCLQKYHELHGTSGNGACSMQM